MKMITQIVLIILLSSLLYGCGMLGPYNSRNLLEVSGEKMKFRYALISIDNVDRVLLLRETNAGKGDAPKPLPRFIMAPYTHLAIEEKNVESE